MSAPVCVKGTQDGPPAVFFFDPRDAGPPDDVLKWRIQGAGPVSFSESEMSTKVFVDGQEGTTGLKIFEYLSARSDIEILRIDEAKRKDVEERRRLINASDVTFLCLPDVASRESASLVENPNTTLIDASTAFRTSADWAYGLPELTRAQREKIRTSKRIAVPGCHASAFVLAMRPLVDAASSHRRSPRTATRSPATAAAASR